MENANFSDSESEKLGESTNIESDEEFEGFNSGSDDDYIPDIGNEDGFHEDISRPLSNGFAKNSTTKGIKGARNVTRASRSRRHGTLLTSRNGVSRKKMLRTGNQQAAGLDEELPSDEEAPVSVSTHTSDTEMDVDNSETASRVSGESQHQERSLLAELFQGTGRRMRRYLAWLEEPDLSPLELPPSSDDLLVEVQSVPICAGMYEVLRRFSKALMLSPFRIEDFCAALADVEYTALLGEIHIALLKALILDDEQAETVFGPPEMRISIDIMFHIIDGMSWAEVLRRYLECDASASKEILAIMSEGNYPYVESQKRISVLHFLCERFLESAAVRSDLLSEGFFNHDDSCRVCGRPGDLICCETCSGVYHLDCLSPPLEDVPEGRWLCPICREHTIEGVSDCVSDTEKSGLMCRQDALGMDRHGRKYWFIARRFIIENESTGQAWYYSSGAQFQQLLNALDRNEYEFRLYGILSAKKEEILRQMKITEDLTEKLKGDRKNAWLTAESEKIQKLLTEQEDAEIADAAEALAQMGKVDAKDDSDTAMSQFPVVDPTVAIEDNNFANVGTDHIDMHPQLSLDNAPKNEEDTMTKKPSPSSSTKPTPVQSWPVPEKPKVCLSAQVQNTKQGGPRPLQTARRAGSLMDRFNAAVQLSETTAQHERELCEQYGITHEVRIVVKRCDAMARAPLTALRSASMFSSSSLTSTMIDEDDEEELLGVPMAKRKARPFGPRIKRNVVTGKVKPAVSHEPFKLGMEGTCKSYVNVYRSNPCAKNTLQRQHEQAKARYINARFNMAEKSSFEWPVEFYGDPDNAVRTLQVSLLTFIQHLPVMFIHPRWLAMRLKPFKQAIRSALTPQQFSALFLELDSCLRPVLYISTWKEAIGHCRLMRETLAMREAHKKLEKTRRDDGQKQDTDLMGPHDGAVANHADVVWVKYPRGVPAHQIWRRDRDEQYRVNGRGVLGGWWWVSNGRRVTWVPMHMQGLRAGPAWYCETGDFIDSLIAAFAQVNWQDIDQSPLEETREDFGQPSCARLPTVLNSETATLEYSPELCFRKLELYKHMETIHVGQGLFKHSVYYKVAHPSKLDKLLLRRMTAFQSDVARAKAEATMPKKPEPTHECYVPSCAAFPIGWLTCYSPTCPKKLAKKSVNLHDTSVKYVLPTTVALPQDSLPVVHSFVNKRGKTSLLRLPTWQVRKLARKGGLQSELYGYNTTGRPNAQVWPYPCLRPVIQTCWRFLVSQCNSLHAAALFFRLFYTSVRWREFIEPPPTLKYIVHTEHAVTHREVLKHEDLAPCGLRNRYFVRTVKIPFTQTGKKAIIKTPTSRSGLRDRKKTHHWDFDTPTVDENWVDESELDMKEVMFYWTKRAREQQEAEEQQQRMALQPIQNKPVLPTAVKGKIVIRLPGGGFKLVTPSGTGPTLAEADSNTKSPTAGKEKFRLTPAHIQDVIRHGLMHTQDEYTKHKLHELQKRELDLHGYQELPRPQPKLPPPPVFTPIGPRKVMATVIPGSGGHRTAVYTQLTSSGRRQRVPVPYVDGGPTPKRDSKVVHVIDQKTGRTRTLQIATTFAPTKKQQEQAKLLKECGELLDDLISKIEVQEYHDWRLAYDRAYREKMRRKHNMERMLDELADNLKREINKRRYLLVKELTEEIQQEAKHLGKRLTSADTESSSEDSSSSSSSESEESQADNEEEFDRRRRLSSTPKWARKDSTSSIPKKRMRKDSAASDSRSTTTTLDASFVPSAKKISRHKLLCVCRTYYDQRRFYVGCDLCSNWFHGDCVGVTEQDAEAMEEWYCPDCRPLRENNDDDKLYCICQTPYDADQFYICCDRCQEWYHGTCVGISEEDAEKIPEYVCAHCEHAGGEDRLNSKTLTDGDVQVLRRLVRTLQLHKMAWPFMEPVDPAQVPDYAEIVKEPMDFEKVSAKINSDTNGYQTLQEFVLDVAKIFDNARLYNAADSPITKCANILETFFMEKMQAVRNKIAKHSK